MVVLCVSFLDERGIPKELSSRKGLFCRFFSRRECVGAIFAIVAEIEKLDFSLADIHDSDGNLVRLKIVHNDLAEVQSDILANPAIKNFLNGKTKDSRLPT